MVAALGVLRARRRPRGVPMRGRKVGGVPRLALRRVEAPRLRLALRQHGRAADVLQRREPLRVPGVPLHRARARRPRVRARAGVHAVRRVRVRVGERARRLEVLLVLRGRELGERGELARGLVRVPRVRGRGGQPWLVHGPAAVAAHAGVRVRVLHVGAVVVFYGRELALAVVVGRIGVGVWRHAWARVDGRKDGMPIAELRGWGHLGEAIV